MIQGHARCRKNCLKKTTMAKLAWPVCQEWPHSLGSRQVHTGIMGADYYRISSKDAARKPFYSPLIPNWDRWLIRPRSRGHLPGPFIRRLAAKYCARKRNSRLAAGRPPACPPPASIRPAPPLRQRPGNALTTRRFRSRPRHWANTNTPRTPDCDPKPRKTTASGVHSCRGGS